MMKRRNIIMVMMTSLLLGSCSSEDILSVPNGNGRIRFDVGVSQSQEVMEMPISTSPMTCGNDTLYAHSAALRNIELHNDVTSKTRGKEVDNSSFPNNFGLYGYIYNSDQSWENNGSELQPTIKEEITKGNTWTSSTYLPGQTKKMALFAYAPYMNTGIEVTGNQGTPQLTYTIDSDVSKQIDLLVAKSVNVVGNESSVELDFKHALTAVKFSVGTIKGFTKITKIVISGVKNSGTLSLYGDNWNLNDDTASYTIKDIDLSSVSGDITGSSTNDLMFLMPQTLPSGAKLEVTMTNDIGTKTFSTDLTGGEWKKGYTVTYLLSVERAAGEFHFEVTPSTSSIPMEGGDFELKVKSYYQYNSDDAKKIPIPWSGTYNMGSNQYTLSGDGSISDDIRKISVPANNSTLTHTETLRANPSKGTAEKLWNLSNSQGEAKVENTANCYVVNSQGTYSIPLVYGCAIKDGSENTISYGTGTYGDKTYSSDTFVNHAGKKITSPYINDIVSGSKFDAKLIWQEVKDMITNVKLSSDKKSLIFTIGKQIAQGNAIVAYTVDDEVVWSWHIWVTDRNINATEKVTTKVSQSHDYDFMPVALGWVDSSEGVSPRLYTFNLTQSQSNKDLSATVNQAGETASGGTCPYYQWGRKDPLMPSRGIKENTETKPCYDISGKTVSFTANTNDQTIKGGILYPEKIINSSNANWDTGTTRNDNWNAINVDTQGFNYNEVVKTVYDPSPVGFKMPPPYAFTGFTDSGSSLASSSNTCIDKTNVYINGFNEGYNFYTNSSKTTTTYWRACGYRAYNGGSLNNVGAGGGYWSAGLYSNAGGCYLLFTLSYVDPQNSNSRALGFSVRPVSE